MLLRFGVSNHLSIKDYQELSFATSSLKDQREGLIDCDVAPNRSVLPAVVIYGPNASGKSNFIAAIRAMQSMILWSQTRGEPDGGVPPRRAFKLDRASSGVPSRFDVDFVVDGVRHHYGFETSSKTFEAEWLYAFPKSHQRALFERQGNDFRFGRGLRGQNNSIAGLTRPNSLFLSAAAQNGHEYLSRIFGFFRSILNAGNISVPGMAASAQITEEGGLDPRVISFLENMNTGVVDYRQREVELPEEIRAVRQELATVLKKITDTPDDIEMDEDDKHVILELAHRGRDGEAIFLDLDLESAGTRRLLIVLGLAYRALDRGWLVCVDELDASLHTQASEAVLKLFCSRERNPKGAQIIATTHDTNLLKSSVLRRDQVWFTEKDPEGSTQLYPLTDIRTRKGDDIRRGYLQGRYGAIPFGGVPLDS